MKVCIQKREKIRNIKNIEKKGMQRLTKQAYKFI